MMVVIGRNLSHHWIRWHGSPRESEHNEFFVHAFADGLYTRQKHLLLKLSLAFSLSVYHDHYHHLAEIINSEASHAFLRPGGLVEASDPRCWVAWSLYLGGVAAPFTNTWPSGSCGLPGKDTLWSKADEELLSQVRTSKGAGKRTRSLIRKAL